MLAIIPARGGSKGLPGKNIKLLNGKPLIAYSIEEAIKSKAVSEVVVSTDSEEIAEVAIKLGAKCPFLRPKELATDEALAVDNYIYTINRLEESYGYNVNAFIVLQPTSPLRLAEDIDNAAILFEKENADSVISYTEEHHPVYWHKLITDEGRLVDIFPERLENRQAFKKTYFPNGSVYIFRKSLIMERKYYTENTFAYIMPRNRSVDIDTIEDFIIAETFIKRRNY
ncbi:MAG TPA: acylneuraminate cytidylyltransferase family protein [Flavisolibacter sp.]|nr:acylneuraminate cytidylyltransferase family protein [Flavisolibacter sp.]